ncbi:MAG TPA: NosD domain-containing protein [Pyrinomonadaceae bacterium]
MNKIRFTLKAFAFLAFTFAFATAAQAQATRTWVSGVGDDVNPCSRTAPCKTFAGAISKTAAGGEIDALDPGGFGAVTITKSITIDGTKGAGFGSILASSVNGVNVNDSATGTPNTIVVTLRNLSINGAGTTLGLNGINFTSGKAVNVEDCQIFNFSNSGINVAKTVASVSAELYVRGTTIFNTGANGIKLSSTGVGSFISASINDVEIKKATNGVRLEANAFAEIRNSVVQFCPTGISMTGSGAQFSLIDSEISHSTTAGIAAGNGTGRLQGSSILLNQVGIQFNAGGVVRTFGDNNLDGNVTPLSGGALTAIVPAKQ